MSTNDLNQSKQPRAADAVLGGQAQLAGLVLGGIEGVKWRLSSSAIAQRIAALPETLNYGQPGLELLIQSLRDESGQVEEAAYRLLCGRVELRAQQAIATDYIALHSSFGADYSRLRDLLGARRWQEANQETWISMFRLNDPDQSNWLNLEHIKHFPCLDLSTIDRLWLRHSGGHFGFSVQAAIWRQIWQKIQPGRTKAGHYANRHRAWEKFGDRVGWREQRTWLLQPDIHYAIGSPVGHLPIGLCHKTSEVALRKFLWMDLFDRLEGCQGQ